MLTDLLESRAVEVARARARAEHAEWDAVLQLREALVAEIDVDTSFTPMYRRMAVNAVALTIAQLLHVSEQQVWRVLEQGGRLRDRAPVVWAAFAAGRIGMQKASTIAVAIERCENPETIAAVQDVAVDYAASHTNAELRRRVHKLIDRLEPVDIDEAEQERAHRNVAVHHTDHGMSELTAYIPSTAAVAIQSRLRKAAKAFGIDHPNDGRTQAQTEADLFSAWLTNATGTDCDIRAEIAVVIEATALAGLTNTPGHVIDTDDDVPCPPEWVLDLGQSGSTLWTRLLTDPQGHVLDVTHLGYQPPAELRRAARWRDRTCRISGCNRPATECDLDHDTPHAAGGPTTGANLRSLCRRHHGIKGHGLLPPDAYAPPEVHMIRLPGPTFTIDYIPAA